MHDVIIIGGGPAGSRVAYKLAEMGHKVMVIERKPRVGEQVCCTGVIGQECVQTFSIKDNVILRKLNSAKLFSPSGHMLRLRREETQACVLDRAAFDMAMARQSEDKGVEYVLGTLAEDIEITKHEVKIHISHQGEESNFMARAAVITNGFGSRLTERSGLGKISDFVIGAQAEVETKGVDETEVYFGSKLAPGFFAWLVPTSTRMARVGLMSRQNPKEYLIKFIALLLAQGKLVSSEVEASYGVIPLKPLARTYDERLLVTGDAAGQVKPTSGGGIYYSLLCADLAADTLHQAMKDDDLSARRLAKYEQRWQKLLGQELKIGYWARRLFECLNDKQIDRAFDIVEAKGIDKALLNAEDISFDWHGKAIMKLMRYQILSRATGVMKFPFRATGD